MTTEQPRDVAREDPGTPTGSLPGILTQIGMILAPTGLIALFCQILDASNRTTGASSLAAVFLTSICIYRRFINRYVPSSLLTGLLVALSALFFFNYQNILLKDTGLIKWYRHSNEFLAEIDPLIMQSHHEVWFFGTNFNISAGERRDALLRKLSSGVNIKYLIFDPKSSHLDDFALDFGQSPGELRSECEKGLESIVELQRQWQRLSATVPRPGELEVRVFAAPPHARFYIFDPERTDGKSLFVPYVNHVNSPNVPAYLLQNVPSGVFQQYFDGIRKLWTSSESLEQHLKNSATVH
jgi:Domain of unknown function (DUF5919)